MSATTRIRKNVITLSKVQQQNYTFAVQQLKSSGQRKKYDDYVSTHNAANGTDKPFHESPLFLPWHRQFILDFESDMRKALVDFQRESDFTLPYWDWAADAASATPQTAPVWSTDLMGGDGDADEIVTTGPFRSTNWVSAPKRPEGLSANRGRFLERGFGRGRAATLPTQAEVEKALAIPTYDETPWDSSSPYHSSFRNALEGWVVPPGLSGPGLHNRLHQWVAGLEGSMLWMTSPNDPVFWLHHCNLDRIWAQWQAKNPGIRYPETPQAPPETRKIRGNEPMWPWLSITPNDVWEHASLGYEYESAIPWPGPNALGAIPMEPVRVGSTWASTLFGDGWQINGGLPDPATQSVIANGIYGITLRGKGVVSEATQYVCLRGPDARWQTPWVGPEAYASDTQWFEPWTGDGFVPGTEQEGVCVPVGPNEDCWFRRKAGPYPRGVEFVVAATRHKEYAGRFKMWGFLGVGTPEGH
jgi:tyrosinase